MDYSQFFNMLPEATLMAVLVIVFIADFALHGNGKKNTVLYTITGTHMFAQAVPCLLADATTAFGGLYVTSNSVNVMKLILTAGTLIVMIMAQPWLNRDDVKNKAGEFYMLVVSTLLGMYMMMSSGHFLMFFLGLEMASVPMACLVAFDKMKKNILRLLGKAQEEKFGRKCCQVHSYGNILKRCDALRHFVHLWCCRHTLFR